MAEEKEEKQEAAASAKKKSPMVLLAVVGGVLVLLVAIGVPVVIMKMNKQNSQTETLAASAAQQEELLPEGHDDEDELEEDEAAIGGLFPLETFVVNLKGGKLIRCQVQLEFVSRDVPKRFYTRNVPIRDGILTLLSERNADDILSEKGKETLKSDIKEFVNESLRKEDVKNVYFTQFIVQ